MRNLLKAQSFSIRNSGDTPINNCVPLQENTDTNMGDTYQSEMSEGEFMSVVSDGHNSFMKTIATRRPIIDLMHKQYTNGNIQVREWSF